MSDDPILVTIEPPPVIDVDIAPPPVIHVDVNAGVPVPGPPGPSGPTPLSYPVSAVSSWFQAHNLGYYPMVHLNQAGTLALVGAEYPDLGHVLVTFPTPFTGTIILN